MTGVPGRLRQRHQREDDTGGATRHKENLHGGMLRRRVRHRLEPSSTPAPGTGRPGTARRGAPAARSATAPPGLDLQSSAGAEARASAPALRSVAGPQAEPRKEDSLVKDTP
ncbi:hypothetical protein ACE1SV_50270 [Streptomyces sp. E-15]